MADTTYKIPHDTLKKEISKPEDFTPPEELYKKIDCYHSRVSSDDGSIGDREGV